MSEPTWTGKTFFLTIWDKSIRNMGIVPEWDNIQAFKGNLETAIKDISKAFYGAFCISKDGAKHIHLAISFDKTKRVSAVAKMLGNAHVEPMRGSKEQAIAYVKKEGSFKEKGEEILAFFGNEKSVQDNSGARLDLQAISTLVKNGTLNASNLDEYILANAQSETQAKAIEGIYIRTMLVNASRMREVKVLYVEGRTGEGKTKGAYERYTDIFRASVAEKTNFPFNGYRGQKVLLLDELRPGVFTPAELFQILDRYPLTVDIKGGRFPAMWETVVITSAMPMNEWFTSKNEDGKQDNNKEQFTRRISEHYIAKGGKWLAYDGEYIKVSVDDNCPFT